MVKTYSIRIERHPRCYNDWRKANEAERARMIELASITYLLNGKIKHIWFERDESKYLEVFLIDQSSKYNRFVNRDNLDLEGLWVWLEDDVKHPDYDGGHPLIDWGMMFNITKHNKDAKIYDLVAIKLSDSEIIHEIYIEDKLDI